MAGAFSTLGSPIGYPQIGWGTAPYGTPGIGTSPWPQQLLQIVPQQLQQLHYLQLQQFQVLQQLQQLLQIVPQQLHQLQHVLQFVPQQIQHSSNNFRVSRRPSVSQPQESAEDSAHRSLAHHYSDRRVIRVM
jgi:hypothetical protein